MGNNEDLQPSRPIRKSYHIKELYLEVTILGVSFANAESDIK